MIYVSLINMYTKGIMLSANKDNSVMGFETAEKGLDYYESSYYRKHVQSYESSMSAIINNISFKPSIVKFESLDELIRILFDGKNESKIVSISNISGRFLVIDIPNQGNAKKLWDDGLKPKLI